MAKKKTTKGMRVATVWKLCLEMWDWIAEQNKTGDFRNVEPLKTAWCEEHGYFLDSECFFCDWAVLHSPGTCRLCPGKAVAPRFNCSNLAYSYLRFPLKFRAKLHRMNKKRLVIQRKKK